MGVSLNATRTARTLYVPCDSTVMRSPRPGRSRKSGLRRDVENPSLGPMEPCLPGTGGTAEAVCVRRVREIARRNADVRLGRGLPNRTSGVYPRSYAPVNVGASAGAGRPGRGPPGPACRDRRGLRDPCHRGPDCGRRVSRAPHAAEPDAPRAAGQAVPDVHDPRTADPVDLRGPSTPGRAAACRRPAAAA